MERRRENPHKSYVKVRCDGEIGGKNIPIRLKTEDGDPVVIDRGSPTSGRRYPPKQAVAG